MRSILIPRFLGRNWIFLDPAWLSLYDAVRCPAKHPRVHSIQGNWNWSCFFHERIDEDLSRLQFPQTRFLWGDNIRKHPMDCQSSYSSEIMVESHKCQCHLFHVNITCPFFLFPLGFGFLLGWAIWSCENPYILAHRKFTPETPLSGFPPKKKRSMMSDGLLNLWRLVKNGT